MQESVRKYLTKLKESRKLSRRNQLVMLAVGLLVVSGVFGMLIMPGLGQEGNLVCGQTEHTHTDDCKGYVCELEEHEHSDSCMECTCGTEEHAHSDDCKEFVCENTEEDHEHTEDCYENNCGKEEHTHSDACYSLCCDIEEHEHSDECLDYTCGMEEHTHEDACYETEEINAQLLADTETNGDANVDEALVVKVLPGEVTEALSGSELIVSVRSASSGSDNTGSATIKVNISELPEGVSLVGFNDGMYTLKTDTGNEVPIYLVKEEGEDGESSYIQYTQNLGDTVAFNLRFESTNGIMDERSSVTVEIDKEGTKIAEEATGNIVIDEDADSVTLTWTAENKWENLSKTVNADKIAVNANNKLSGELTYTITAKSLNKDGSGEIWTSCVKVTDTLTLTDGIRIPSGAYVNMDNGTIETEDGETIISFTELQGGKVTSLEIGSDRKSVTYKLEIPNPYMDEENEVPTKEMEHLSLKMQLNAYLLKLDEGFILKDKSVVEAEKIHNKVEVQPQPYKGTPEEPMTAEVETIPTLDDESFTFTKTADKTAAQAGEVIQYTITLTNTGETPIVVKNGTEYYTVEDTLPMYLELTTDQITALQEKGVTVTKKNTETSTDGESTVVYTISWVPSEDKIIKGQAISLTFDATVKKDGPILQLNNNDKITNKASYKGKTAEAPVNYKDAAITVTKTAAVVGGGKKVENGGQIEYTLTVKNTTDVAALTSEMVYDSLPKGLTFVSATIGTETLYSDGKDVTLHAASGTHGEDHKVDFTIVSTADTKQLTWNVGKLAANEEIKLTFICSVNTDELESSEEIKNTVTLSSGKENSCVVGVESPLKVDKQVKLAVADTAYADGIAEAYPNKTSFDYKIVVSNDATIPSEKNVVLVDQMPAGMLPEGITIFIDNVESDLEWAAFVKLTATEMSGKKYTATVGGKEATVENENGAVKFTWELGVITETVTIEYQAKLADENIISGTLLPYTNTATIGDITDSVTVYGGDNSGKIVINKQICHNAEIADGYWLFGMKPPSEEEKNNYPGYFVISGTDTAGNPVVFEDNKTELTVKLSDFEIEELSVPPYAIYSYEKTGLPAGTYTIEEKNYNGETGYNCHPVFDNGAGTDGSIEVVNESTAQLTVVDNGTTIVDVANLYYTADTVDLQKNVYAIAKGDANSDSWQLLADKNQFYIGDGKDTYVIYNIIMTVGGGADLSGHYTRVNLTDQLPDELSFVGIYDPASCDSSSNTAIYEKSNFKATTKTTGLHIDLAPSVVGNKYSRPEKVAITANYDTSQNKVSFDFRFPDYKAGKLTETFEVNEIRSNKIISFLMLCKVNGDLEEGQEITNTAKLEVVEDKVFYTEKKRYQTYRTPYDENQNNGETERVSGGDGTGSKTVLTSSVTVTPKNTIVPGIEKEAVSYIVSGSTKENSLNEESSIVPNSAVKWEITIHNNGTEAMEGYSLTDVVTSPFHFMTKAEAKKFDISSPYMYDIYTFDGWHSGNDISEQVYEIIEDGSEINETTFDFLGDYSIPAGGYAVLTIYTNNTIGSYKAYKNTATIYTDPSKDFSAEMVKYGELVKDSNGKYVGVTASDSVYAFGEYATVSWKTIEEKKDATNKVKGTDKKNYIFVENDSRDVVYTNNIKNISTNVFTDVVVIDVMPMKNDRGVVNQSEKRGSEFRVLYTEGSMSVKVLDSSGNLYSEPPFTVQFSEASSFSENDFAGADTSKWHSTCTEDDRSFRVMFSNDFVLDKGQTLVIEYEGKVEDAAVPGAIAWNSFGYQYKCGEESLRAEPPKVGVMIPPVSIIQKEVVDSNGDVQEKDASKEFSFILWNKEAYDETATEEVNKENAMLCEFKIGQGGYLELTKLKDKSGNCALVDGKEYMITENEAEMPEGYNLVGIGIYGEDLSESCTFTYHKEKSINILARNSVEQYVKELPATGGFSALAYKVTGTVLVLLAGLLGSWRLIIRRKQRNL